MPENAQPLGAQEFANKMLVLKEKACVFRSICHTSIHDSQKDILRFSF